MNDLQIKILQIITNLNNHAGIQTLFLQTNSERWEYYPKDGGQGKDHAFYNLIEQMVELDYLVYISPAYWITEKGKQVLLLQ